ncbi:MAG: hypothetical protein Kow0059_03440 [Candidatus Sumerlaeia bacterium]
MTALFALITEAHSTGRSDESIARVIAQRSDNSRINDQSAGFQRIRSRQATGTHPEEPATQQQPSDGWTQQVESTTGRPAEKQPIMTPAEVRLYGAVGIGLFVLLIAVVVVWLRAKSRTAELLLMNREQEFEREMLKEFARSAGKTQGDLPAPGENPPAEAPLKPEASPPLSAAPSPAFPDRAPSGSPAGLHGRPTTPPGAVTGADAPLASGAQGPGFDALAEDICRRLDAAGLLLRREGPFVLNESDTRGFIVRLKGERLALIIADWESEKFVQRQLKRFEVIIVARDAGTITVLQPFSRYLGNQIILS